VTTPPMMTPRTPPAPRDALGAAAEVERWVVAKATVAALRATTTAATPIQSTLRLIVLPCRCLAGDRLDSDGPS
jgi:hypothetical protein